jgi:hypothetical protein
MSFKTFLNKEKIAAKSVTFPKFCINNKTTFKIIRNK